MSIDFVDLVLPTESADGYYMNKKRSQVDSFIYVDPRWYKRIFDPSTFYILGSKGSGKTLYAAYMCAEKRKDTVSRSHIIDVSDYGKLIAMKTSNHLGFTDYLTMWKVILLQKFLFGIESSEISLWTRNKSLKDIKDTISTYLGYDVSDDSFNPVIVIDSCGKQTEVTNFLSGQTAGSAAVSSTSASVSVQGHNEEKEQSLSEQKIERKAMLYTDTWMRSINEFRKVLSNISFKNNHYLFVDGLDVRPSGIDAKEYGECISALVRAVYDINTKILGNMPRKGDRDFKIIALTRTDIFLNSNLVNVTSCINDNCIELDWSYSNEKEFIYSNLYRMMNRVLGWDGESRELPVEYYFSFLAPVLSKRPIKASMFIQRLSRLRPRDIVVMLRLIQAECISRGIKNPDRNVLTAKTFEATYSKYYADQIRSEMMFRYSFDEINNIFDLIKMLRSDVFSEEEFAGVYGRYTEMNPSFKTLFPNYRSVLDALYSLDLIGWREIYHDSPKLHWHYREVKAIDETGRMPWEQMFRAQKVKLLIHSAVRKFLFGAIM